MIGKTFLYGQTSEAYVNARLLRITVWILGQHFPELSNSEFEQHDVNIVVQSRLSFGSQLSIRSALYQFRAGRSTSNGSPKYSKSCAVLSKTGPGEN